MSRPRSDWDRTANESTENRPRIDYESTADRPRIDYESTADRPRMSSCGWCSTARTDPFCSKSATDVHHADGQQTSVRHTTRARETGYDGQQTSVRHTTRALIPATGDTNTRPREIPTQGHGCHRADGVVPLIQDKVIATRGPETGYW
jgi:hypothetical protein